MKLVTLPNPILSLKSAPIEKIDEDIKNLARQMVQTLEAQKNPEGIGLAAPQVGILKRIFIAKIKGKSQVFINPEIISKSKKQEELVEGCLSTPDYYGPIKRSNELKVQAQNLNGKKFTKTLTGLEAKIIQHEIDHLDGKLFLNHLAAQKQKLFRRIGKDKKGQEKFAEVAVPWLKSSSEE